MTLRRAALLSPIALLGLVAGLWIGSALGSSSANNEVSSDRSVGISPSTTTVSDETDPDEPPSTVLPPKTTLRPRTTTPSSTTAPVMKPVTMLLWAAGGLDPGFAALVARVDGVRQTSAVRGEQLPMVLVRGPDGDVIEEHQNNWRVALDVLAVEPATFARFADADSSSMIASLGPGEALLTETSARLRGLEANASDQSVPPGSTLGTIGFLDGSIVSVVGVIDDVSGGGAELIVDRSTGEGLGVAVDRFVLVRFDGDRVVVESQIRSGPDVASLVRVRVTGETPYLRHGDAVQPQAVIKDRFGEFAFRPGAGRAIEIEPAWVSAHIETREVPILGKIRCHRDLIPAVDRAMRSLVSNGRSHVVDPTRFSGCFNPRRIGSGSSLSRHAWGVALDLNIGSNPRGSFSTQDPALVTAMTDAGLGWGGEWLVPDPGHYEWLVDQP